MTATIRAAAIGDCDAIAQIHVAAWRETYPGMVPQSELDSLSAPSRAMIWRKSFEQVPPLMVCIAEDAQGCVGFAAGGPCRDDVLRQDMEIYAIYLLDRIKRQGIGRKLMSALAEGFASRGAKSAGLWVLRENLPARRFYETLGGRSIAEKVEHNPGFDLTEVGYVWSDLRQALSN